MPNFDFADQQIRQRDSQSELQEMACRRESWRPGVRIILSGGGGWWLPPLDLALLTTCPRFRRDANTAIRLAHNLEETPPESSEILVRYAVYHAQMVQMGVTLLQQNYALEPSDWAKLTSFPGLEETFRFSGVVAEVFAAASGSWLALLVQGEFLI